MLKTTAVILASIVVIPMMALSIILDSLILVKLWEWFLVSYFHLSMISIPQAIGLSGIAKFLTFRRTYKPDRELKWHENWQGIINDLFIFAVCYIAHLFL